MNCKTQEEFNSAIEHHYALNEIHPDQTVDQTVRFVDLTTANAEKSDGKYKAKGGTAEIKQSVTEKVGRKFKYFKENPLLEQQGLIGNQIHDMSEYTTRSIIDITNEKSTTAAIEYIKNLTSIPEEGLKKIEQQYGKTLDAKSRKNLLEGIKDNLLSIYRQQRTINTLTGKDGRVTIRLEQILLDPVNDIGGTADFVAFFSDNTAGIIDYKTKIIPKSNLDAFGNIIDPSKVVKPQDVEKYKLQTGEYGRILRQRYGVKSIRNVTILPIKLVVSLNTTTGKYSSKIEGLAFPGQDKLLEKVVPFANKTGFKSLDDFVSSIQNRIDKLEQRIKQDYKLRDQLQPRIDELNKSKNDILINHNLNTVLEYGRSLASKVSEGEAGNLTIPELQDLIEELDLLASISKSTLEYRQFLKGTSKANEVEEIESKIGRIVMELEDKAQILRDVLFEDKVTKLIELHTGYKITDDFGNFIPFAQEGYFGKWFYQLSQYDNPLFKTLKSILNDINYKTRQKTDKVVEDIVNVENKVYDWLKKSGKTFKDLVDIMIDPATDNFWSKYEGEYVDDYKRANGSTLYQYYAPSDNHEEWFMNKVFEKTQQFSDEGLTGKDLQDKIDYWISQNSLELVDGKPKYPDAWELARRYGRLHLIDSPENYNKHYQYIRSVPELSDYYSMFEKYNKEFRDLLGVEYTKLPNNFLPNIRKQMSERITEQGFNGFLSGTQDFFKDFNVREEDRSADSTYNSNNQIPIFFLNRFQNKDFELQVGEKSYQFGRSLAIFAKMAYNYEASTAREAEILALQQLLSTEAEQVSQSRGKNLIDKMGNQLTEKLQATDLPDIFKSFVDMYIYKINVKPIIGDKSGRAEKMLLKAKEYFTLKTLGFSVIAGLGSLTSAKINTLIEANKGIIFNKTNYTESMKASWSEREKFLAINAYFDPMGHRFNNPSIKGEKQLGERHYADPTMRGWVNKYVNSRMLMNTFSIGDEYIEEMITAAMAKNYYISENGNVKSIKSTTPESAYKGKTIWDLFSYNKQDGAKFNVTEEQMQNAFTSFRVAIQAGQSRIKGTIPEEDKAHWQNNIIMQLVMHFKSWMPGILFERFGKVKFDSRIDSIYMGKYTAALQELSLNPDKLIFKDFFKKLLLPKLGRLLADVSTFGLLSKNRLNDKFNKELMFNKWLDENPHLKGKVTFEEYNEVQQKQLKSVIQELRVLLVFAGLIILLGFDWNDDSIADYKEYMLTRKIASLIFKTQQELAFTYSPLAFSQMIKSPLPVLGLVSDAYRTIKNTIDELLDLPFGEDRLIGGEKKDKTPILSQSIKWLPGGAGISKFLEFFDSSVQYENQQQ